MKERKSESAGRRVVVGAAGLLLVAGAMLWGGVSTQAAGSPGPTSAAGVENPSAAIVAIHIADADRDVLEQQLD